MDRVRELSPATGYFSPPPRHAPPAHRSQLGPSRRRQPKMPSSGPEKRLSWSLPDQHIAGMHPLRCTTLTLSSRTRSRTTHKGHASAVARNDMVPASGQQCLAAHRRRQRGRRRAIHPRRRPRAHVATGSTQGRQHPSRHRFRLDTPNISRVPQITPYYWRAARISSTRPADTSFCRCTP